MPANFPDIPRTRSGFKIQPATRLIRSTYNQVEEIWEEPGDMWQARLAFSFLTKAEARELRGVLTHYVVMLAPCSSRIPPTAMRARGMELRLSTVSVSTLLCLMCVVLRHRRSWPSGGDRFQLNNRRHELVVIPP